jgi:hypothetical protein
VEDALPPHRLLDGGHNVGVSAAATDVAAHELADLIRSFRLALRDQTGRRADLPRRAVPALESVVVDERLLQRMQRAVDSEAFNRGDLGTVVHHRKCQAGIDAPSVNEHRAGATLSLIAALFRSGQLQVLAHEIEDRRARIEREGMRGSVDLQAHRDPGTGAPIRASRRIAGGVETWVCSAIGHRLLHSGVRRRRVFSYRVPAAAAHKAVGA